MTDTLFLDIETRSTVNLRARPAPGAYRYFECPHADVLCAAWAINDEPVQGIGRDMKCLPLVREAILDGVKVSGWNVGQFEKIAFKKVLGPRYGWPVPKDDQWDDTMAQAAAMALPLALGMCAEVLGLDEQKDKEGTRLINKFSKPRRARKGEVPGTILWNEPEAHREDFDRFIEYCRTDVEVERAIKNKLVPLSETERRVWLLDMAINERGLYLDRQLVDALESIAEQTRAQLDREMAEVTRWEITACSQASALTNWINGECAFKLVDGVSANEVDAALKSPDIPPHVRRALELRQMAAKTSTAKLDSLKATVCENGRISGLMQYHGASTGRWAGRLSQPHNMPRGTGTVPDPDRARPHLLKRDPELINMLYGNPLFAVSDCLRACFSASPGNRLFVADYSSIEGRVTAWLAGEDWKLEVFRKNDRGEGPGAYETAAAGIYNVPADKVSKAQRQVGKAAELGLGFAGGVMAFKAMADIYRVDMAEAYDPIRETADPTVFEKAIESHERWSEEGLFGTEALSREAWIASEVTKVAWRLKHPAIVELWDGLETAIKDAIHEPGTICSYGRVSYLVRRGFLWCRLPSGRCLAYGKPRIEDQKTPWGSATKGVTVVGMKTVKGGAAKWMRYPLNKSVIVENVVQAVARDLLAHGLLKLDEAGYPLVLHVHDEAVADVPEGFGSLAHYESLLCDLPEWAAGLPLVAEGYEAQSYRK
ncbi:DNA polymerase [Nitratireductor aquimarinus]|uniref:DNA polymerase n=1 Tax=Nitratireductor aquimarinus TaxID=889300 RepID=UPI002935D857|nr:DNA polymerase [Nitratireductor aquimarinus]MDV2964563.1 DNA polymerase [Nitratireductor aquimarinus]